VDKLWNKLFNRETITYLIFGVLTTLVDWISFYIMSERMGIHYLLGTCGAWAAAVAFAFITNKLFVFGSRETEPGKVIAELVPFVAGRLGTGLLVLGMMKVMVDVMKIPSTLFCKVVTSAISLVLNYVFSKWFIFKKTASRSN